MTVTDARQVNEAHRRAHPASRLLAAGLEYADVVALRSGIDQGRGWVELAEALGDTNASRAEEALRRGAALTASSWHLYAASCYRVGQAVLPDVDPDKRRIYRKAVDQFRAGGALRDPAFEYLAIPYGAREVRGWLIRPPGIDRPPVVIVIGGFDGWREEHEFGSRALMERGVAVLLLEAPGQGETRLFSGNVLHDGFEEAFSAVLDMVLADARLGDQVGLWGNSFGGHLVAHVAIADDRFGAVCVNGGTVRPVEVLDRFPRLVDKVGAMLGVEEPEAVRTALQDMELQPTHLASLSSPLLVLHGTPDQIFLAKNARELHDGAASEVKAFVEWADGEHCIYNHPHERNTMIADFFAAHLS